ncbi:MULTISPECIES: nucleotidyltransferase family protein [unclassified Thiocapsa]|uniref:nucleotidyltransferase family protein n=1 Tax=unclassified Thiocapsa TaxID=2641286 RepID=UPI0035B14D8B
MRPKFSADRSTTASALILACKHGDADTRHLQWRALLDRGIDWNLFLILGEQHDLLPLLFRGLEDPSISRVPQHLVSHLSDHFQANWLRNRLALQSFLNVEASLSKADIPTVLLKGLALANTVYEHPALRQFGDVDFLIPWNRVSRAREILESADYRPIYPPNMLCDIKSQRLTRNQEDTYSEYYHEITMQSLDKLLQLDLHWNLLPRHYPIGPDVGSIWKSSRTAMLVGHPIRTLSTEHQLLHTCVHATKDGWRKLKWVVDVDRIVRSDGQIDWDRVADSAKGWRCERMIGTGIQLARELLDTPIPIGSSWPPSRKASARDVSTVINVFLRPERPRSRVLRCLGINATLLRLLDTHSCRRRYVQQALTMPRPEDEALFGTQTPNRPLWNLRRPFWVLARCMGRIGKPGLEE